LTKKCIGFFFFFPFGEGEGVGFLFFPICSQHVPNRSFTLYHIICLKFYSCNLYKQPEGGDYKKSILRFCIVLFYFICCDGSIKDAHNNRKLLGSRQLVNMSHNMKFVTHNLFFLGNFFCQKVKLKIKNSKVKWFSRVSSFNHQIPNARKILKL
jgi:hypothetical protein